MRKLIFFDVDGTLVGNDNIMPESAKQAIAKARENGHLCFVCTGRSKIAGSDVLQYGFDGLVASAGGYVVVDGRCIYESSLSKEMIDKAVRVFEENNVYYNFECNNATFMDDDMVSAFFEPMVTETCTLEEVIQREDQYFNIQPMTAFDPEIFHVQKMCFITKNLNCVDNLYAGLSDDYQVVIHTNFSFGEYIAGEIIPLDSGKGKGIEQVVNYLNADIKDTIAFGDSMNDLPMMQTVAYSVAMGNGSDEIKQYVDTVCESVENDGIYHELKRLNIIE